MSDYPKMKVLFAVNDFTMGGAQRLYVDLFDELDRSSFELHLLTLRQFPQRQDLYHLVNAEVVVHRLNFLSFRSLGQWVKLLLLLRRIRPDVVVSSLFFTNTIVRVLKPLLGYRVLSMEHNTYIHKTRAQILVDRILAKLTEKIIAVSTTVGEFTIEQQRLQPSKVQVIHNGVNVRAMSAYAKERSPATVRELLGFKPDDKIIINVGRLTEQKNHKLLIQGFASFSAKHPGYLLCLLGEGNLREDLVARARAQEVARMLGAEAGETLNQQLVVLLLSQPANVDNNFVVWLEAQQLSYRSWATLFGVGRHGSHVDAVVYDLNFAGLQALLLDCKLADRG
jgi:glycosyltransferase involved in cell wall biosynthesis